MRLRRFLWVALAFLPAGVEAQESLQLKTQQDKVSYSIGIDIGGSLKRQSIEINTDAFMKGIQDGLSGSEGLLSQEETRQVLEAFQNEMRAKAEAQARQVGEKNRREGEAFLSENKKKKGVVVLPSGLQYQVIQAGKGASPKSTDTVKTHYRGTLIDGTEFDSSHKRGEPVTFPVDGVIAGWTEALQLMKVGAKWKLYVPAALAYGERGAGPLIGPNATLIFEVELLGIEKGGG